MRGNERGGLQRNSNGAGIISAAEHFCRNPTESGRPRWERTRGSPGAPGAAPAPPGPRAPAPGAAAAPRCEAPGGSGCSLLALRSRSSSFFPPAGSRLDIVNTSPVSSRHGRACRSCHGDAMTARGGCPLGEGRQGKSLGGASPGAPLDPCRDRAIPGLAVGRKGCPGGRAGRGEAGGTGRGPLPPQRCRGGYGKRLCSPSARTPFPPCLLASLHPCLLPSPRRQRRAAGAPQAGSGAPAGGGEPGAKGRAGAGGKRPRPGAPLSPRAPATSRRGPGGEGSRLGGCRSLPKPASASEAAWQRAGRGEVHVG